MAIYTYTPSGGIIVGYCCIPVTFYEYYSLPFGPGDIAFVKQQSQLGVLEKIVIKNYTLKQSPNQALYKDTLNRLWFDYELVSSAVAIQLAESYYERLLNQAANAPCPC
jgi:hypothetical protein